MSEWAKMVSGLPYDPRHPDLVAARAHARELTAEYNLTRPEQAARRAALLGELLGDAGEGLWIEPPFFCDYGRNVTLGRNVFFNFNCVILDVAPVRMGDDVFVGPAVQIYTAAHYLDAARRRRDLEFGRPVNIGSDVWIGGGAILLPGVSVGDRAVIGAGSVVVKDVPADVFAAGNPCRVVRPLVPGEYARGEPFLA
jgi:maltose O-acetyltransferase